MTGGTGSRRVLKLHRAKRTLQAYQAYLVLFGETALPQIEGEYLTYKVKCAAVKKEPKTRLVFQSKRARELLEQEDEGAKARVKAFRKDPDQLSLDMVDGLECSGEHRRARATARYVTRLVLLLYMLTSSPAPSRPFPGLFSSL